jgi:hypothetical protein
MSEVMIAEQKALAEEWVPPVTWHMQGETFVDFASLERRVIDNVRLTAVVEPPLTVFEKGRRMFRKWFWEIILLIALGLFLVWAARMTPAYGACEMSYCKDKAPTRSYITNTHRQKVGDLYKPGSGQRTQIRDRSRRIIGYVEMDGTITNTHRQKKGHLND